MNRNVVNEEDFEQLMSELAAGSEEAAGRIAQVYTPHILRAVRASLPRSIRSKLDSQDFAQVIWASLMIERAQLQRVKTPQELINLLVRVAHHKVVDAYRHYTIYQARDHRRESPIENLTKVNQGDRARQVDGNLLDRELSPSQTASLRERWQALVEGLSTRDRNVLRLRMNGKTYSEIGDTVGIGVSTVKDVLDKIVAQLRYE